jgi:hypothetical protein
MSVVFGFHAYKPENTELTAIDLVEDWNGEFTNTIIGTVPLSLEEIERGLKGHESYESVVSDYHEYFKKMRSYGILETDLDFLMFTSNCYSGYKCNRFFDAGECYEKFIRFIDYHKKFTNITHYSKKDMDNFAEFFLKHSKEKHLVQGFWT